jgi:hypothetical protein
VFIPLPFFACAPGKKTANGDLFEHMHDPSKQATELETAAACLRGDIRLRFAR